MHFVSFFWPNHCVEFESEEENTSLWTFPNKVSCQNNCPYYCITDDTGEDGILSPPEGEGFGFIQPDEDGTENNGQPDCNEPNVDEYNEILPNVHVNSNFCEVKIYNNGTYCDL